VDGASNEVDLLDPDSCQTPAVDPVCGSPVQRIVHAENETNYCAKCQTGEKLLADRSLSKLLKDDWPRTLEEMEEVKKTRSEYRG
jgi:hypothetical protein